MLKLLHVTFVTLSLVSFLGRFILSEKESALMHVKWMKIAPHILNTFLLLTGFMLVVQGGWLGGDFSWIVAKLIALLGFVGLGMMALKHQNENRWYAFVGALLCFMFMAKVAATKTVTLFF